jgi:hypothetical protein
LVEFIHSSYLWNELKVSFLIHDKDGEKWAFEMIAPVLRHAFSGESETYHLRDVDALAPLSENGSMRGWTFEAKPSGWLSWLEQNEPVLESAVPSLRHFVIFGLETCLHMVCRREPTFRTVF